MGPNFDKARFVSPVSLEVSGTFDTHAEVFEDVIVRILVVPEGHSVALTNPMVGEARFAAPDPISVPTAGRADDKLTSATFTAQVTGPSSAYIVAVGDRVRII